MVAEPWLSVIMPTFDGAQYVGDALASVAREADDGIEVVVVDDGSTDGTVARVREFENRLRLRIIAGARNAGWIASTNTGLAEASADLATFLHQDDSWLPGRVSTVRAMFARAPDAALAVHAARFVSERGADLGPWRLPLPPPGGVVDGGEFAQRLLVQNFLCAGAPVFRRRDALQSGGLDERYWYTADWDLWLRLAPIGRVVYASRPFISFRVHGKSQTATRSAEPDGFRSQLVDVFERHLGNAPAAVERAGRAAIELNVALATASHGRAPAVVPLLTSLASMRPASLRVLARDARLGDRVGARLRARARGR